MHSELSDIHSDKHKLSYYIILLLHIYKLSECHLYYFITFTNKKSISFNQNALRNAFSQQTVSSDSLLIF